MKGYNKKGNTNNITACLSKATEAHLIDVNGKDTKLVLAVKTNILCYSLIDNKFVAAYEGHASNILKLKYMEYSIDQKKEIDDVTKEYFMSIAENEQLCNIWRSSEKENGKVITSPLKMLELTDKKDWIGIQIKQIAGQYYFAICITTHSVWGYVCNLKTKTNDDSVLKKCDFKVSMDKALINKNLFVTTSNIINESELVVLKGNSQALDTHYFTYLDEEGKTPGTDLKIEPEVKASKTNGADKNGDVKMMGLEYDQIQQKSHKVQNGILNGVNLDKLEGKIDTLIKGSKDKAIKSGSLVAVLEQSLHANDIETINWVLGNTDTHIITETVKKLNKGSLQSLMQNILIKLQQGVQKSALLWLSIVLKLRWIDVIRFMNTKSSQHSSQSLSTIHTYLNRKTKNLPKYYEVSAKLQMVIESGEAMSQGMQIDEETKEYVGEHNSRFPRESVQVEEDSDESDVDEVVEDTGFAQVVEGEGDEEGDSDGDSGLRDDIEQYADDGFGEDDDEEMDIDDEEDDIEDYE